MSSIRLALATAVLAACAAEPPSADIHQLVAAWRRAVPATSPLPDAASEGQRLFTRVWSPGDPEAGGDGLGPLYNATSCAACHSAPGLGGAGGVADNAVFLAEGGQVSALHRAGVAEGYAESRRERTRDIGKATRGDGLGDVTLANLLGATTSTGTLGMSGRGGSGFGAGLMGLQGIKGFAPPPTLIERNTPALYGAGLIDRIPAAALVALSEAQLDDPAVSGRIGLDAEGRVARFGWKGDVATLHDFVDQACANELGLSTDARVEPRSELDEPVSLVEPDLSTSDVHALTAFVAALPAPDPVEAHAGETIFTALGCAACHVREVGGVDGLYSDLLLHDMGTGLADVVAMGAYGGTRVASLGAEASSTEFRTPPLWGVADSGPWLHDGRADTLGEAIRAHGGEARPARDRFVLASGEDRLAVLDFLDSLRAPAPPGS